LKAVVQRNASENIKQAIKQGAFFSTIYW